MTVSLRLFACINKGSYRYYFIMEKRTSAAVQCHEKNLITVLVMDGLEYYDAKIVDPSHLPSLNKISKADQKEYLDQMKHRSYESEIEIKWVGAGYIAYKNVHLIKLPECDEKRSKRGRDNSGETRKKNISSSVVENKASCKKAKRGVMCTRDSVAVETCVRTLPVTMTAELEARNGALEDMNVFLNEVVTPQYGTDGREYWPGHIKNNPILMQSIADRNTYTSIKQYINTDKKFTNVNKVFPVYLASSSEFVFLSTFRYKVPADAILEADKDHTLGYYEARAIYEGNLVNYTISKDFLCTLKDLKLDSLHKNKNKWSDIRFGDKQTEGLTTVIPTKELSNTCNVNHFTHKGRPYTTCMLSSVASAMWAMGLLEPAISFFREFQAILNVTNENLWINLHAQSGKAFPNFKFRKTITPGGISAENVMEMNDEWAIVLQIISKCGLPSHCICICNGIIYDANSTITLPKTLANLHLCAQLHIPGRADYFYCTKWIRRLIPQNMILNNNPHWDTDLPPRDGWNNEDPARKCVICCEQVAQCGYSKTQWRKAGPKCRNCIP